MGGSAYLENGELHEEQSWFEVEGENGSNLLKKEKKIMVAELY